MIHASVVAEHFGEDPLLGWFFVAVMILQVGWAALLLGRPSHLLLTAGALGNALLMGVWVLTRTVGIPIGPDAGTAESVGLLDALATTFELASVLIVFVTLRPGSMAKPVTDEPIARWLPITAAIALSSAILVGGFADRAASTLSHGHALHVAIIGAAGLAFSGYLGVEFSRHGVPSFSWRLRVRS